MTDITNLDRRVPLTKDAVRQILDLNNGQKIPTKLNKRRTRRFGKTDRFYLDDVDWFLENEWQKHIEAQKSESFQIKENSTKSTGGAQSPKELELSQHALKIINLHSKS